MPLAAAFVQEKLALDEKRWNDVLIDAPAGRLTKRDVFNYYSHPKIRKAMLEEMNGRGTIVRQTFAQDRHVLKRNELGRPIRISRDAGGVNDPRDFTYFTERRATEFHPTFGRKEKRLVVDLDPGAYFSFEKTKRVTGQVRDLVSALPGMNGTEVRFSGGRGFYVIGHLKNPMDVDRGRELLKQTLRPLVEEDHQLTLGVSRDDQMRIDLTPYKEHGSVRGLYSLNALTGLTSMPIKDLAAFQPLRDATIEAVLGGKPQDAPHVR